MTGFGTADCLNMCGKMTKSEINIELAKSLYEKYKNIHKVAKEMHTSHIKLSALLKENGVEIYNVGKSKILSENEIKSAINDYVTNRMTTVEISKKYHIQIKKLRKIFKENNVNISRWNGHVKKEKVKKEKPEKPITETKKCPYCNWETVDVKGKGHSYAIHLVHKHNIDLNTHLGKYPEDKFFLNDELNRRENKIQCKICGKWLNIIDNRHLKKHGMNKSKYMSIYSGSSIISEPTKKKLQINMEKMMENETWERKTSTYEKEIEDFLIKNGIKFKKHDRSILNGLELDFLIGDIGIEFNGNKYHTEFFGKKDKHYHLNKTELCNLNNIKLIQIFEDEYKYHKDIVYSKLSHTLNLDSKSLRIAGRKCTISEINKTTAYNFLEKYHIQGFTSSSLYLGAFYNNELIAVMSFLNEHALKWNLTRFATNYNYVCQGVGGKLFSYFIKNYNPEEVKSFADRRWTINPDNNLYTKLGFKLEKTLKPDYRYYNEHIDKYIRWHKFGFRKHILSKKYGFPITMTESEMAKELGYDRIWDCGLFKYVWKPNPSKAE